MVKFGSEKIYVDPTSLDSSACDPSMTSALDPISKKTLEPSVEKITETSLEIAEENIENADEALEVVEEHRRGRD